MPDLSWLAELGAAVVLPLATPLLLWTLLALLVEAVLRAVPSVPAVSALAVRRGVLFSLPLLLVTPLLGSVWASPVATIVAAGGTVPFELPELVVGPTSAAPDVAWSAWSTWGLVALALAGATGVSLVRFGIAVQRLSHLRRAADPAPPPTQALAQVLSARAGLSATPHVGLAPDGATPFTLGIQRPLIVVPRDLDGEPLRLALAHEVAHVRRRDFAWTLAERAVVALCVAHPLVHVVAKGAALDRECLADADVLGERPAQRRAYADLLLRFAASSPPALAVGAGGFSPLKHRIAAMNRLASPRSHRRDRWVGRVLATAVIALTLGVGVAGASPASPRFELVQPTVTINGVASAISGSVRAETFSAFSIEVPGYGRILFSATPFAGSDREGWLNSTMLLTAEPGQYVMVTSDEPVVPEGERQRLYVRFDLAADTRTPAPGFQARLSLAADVSALAADAPPRPGSALEARADTTMPELVGGLAALQRAVVYPAIQRDARIEGRSFIQVVVTETGETRDAIVARSSGDEALDAAALAAVKDVRFRPGTVEGRPVAVRFVVPITFRLGDDPSTRPAPPPPPPAPPNVDLPELVGGLAGLQQAVVYPEVQRRAGVQGVAYIQFVVSETGAVRDAEVVRTAGDEALDAAALAAVRSATFRPGRRDGQLAPLPYVVPIRFELPDADGR